MAIDGYFPRITLSGTDTRKGDGIAFLSSSGKCMLVDAFDGGEATTRMISWLKSKSVAQIDLAVLTHAHGDHWGGFRPIVNAGIPIKEFRCYDPNSIRAGNAASREDADNLLTLIRWLQARGTRVVFIDHGITLKFDDISWHVFRKQPASAASDDTNAWEYVNNGSLVLYSPELQGMLPGDGPEDQKDAIAYFQKKLGKVTILKWTDITHHGGSYSKSNAEAAKAAGCEFAFESCVERGGAGTTDWTLYGARRLKQQGIEVWMQDADIYIHAARGRITFQQSGKTRGFAVPYAGNEGKGWLKDRIGWWYSYGDGTWAVGWAKLPWSKGPSWFYFNERGYMLTGWQKLSWSQGENWFYFDPVNGDMKTGWIFVDSCWYYLDPVSGAMQTGWLDYNDKKCYLEPVAGKNQGHCYVNCTAVIDGKMYRFDRDGYATEFDGSSSMAGVTRVIDLSEHNDKTIDWNKVKSAGYGVIIRIGLRGSMKQYPTVYGKIRYDNNYKTYLDGIIKAGIPYSVYFFPTSISDAEADQEADWIRMNVADLALSMPVYLDSEMVDSGAGRADGLSKADRTRYLKRIIDKLKEAGIECGVYASTSWLNNKLDMSQLVGVPVWCAQYASKCTYSGDYVMWQYSSKASVPGINGNVDISQVMNPIPSINNAVDVMISIAQSEVGYHEDANNSTKYGNELHSIQPSNMDKNAAWCDAFVDWCVLQTCRQFGKDADTARAVLCGDFDDYTYFSVNLYKKAGRWTQTPARGYQIFFGGSGHTGIVTKVEGGKVYTIEGNKSDAVRECSYNIGYSNIIGYGMPRYDLI